MATAAVTTQTLPQSGQSKNQTFNPLIHYDPAATERSHNLYARLWNVAAIASAVAFIVFATSAVVFAALYAEAYLPVVTMLALFPGLPLSLRPIRLCWQKAQINRGIAKFAYDVNKHYQRLKNSEMHAKISKLVKPGTDAKKLKSIYARYLTFLDHIEQTKKRIKKFIDAKGVHIDVDGKKVALQRNDHLIANLDLSKKKEREKLQKVQNAWRVYTEGIEQIARDTLDAAYCLRLMEKPYEKIDPSKYVTIIDIPAEIRHFAFSNYFDISAKVFAKVPPTKKIDEPHTYTAGMLNTTPLSIAEDIFEVQPACRVNGD